MEGHDVLRIGVTVGPSGHGGIATYGRELIAALARRPDVELVFIGTRDEIAGVEALRSDACDSAVTGDDVVIRGPRTLAQLRVAALGRSLRRRSIELVHVTRMVAPLRWSGPIVMTFHDDYPVTRRHDYDLVKRWLLPPIFLRSIRRAAAVVTLNGEMAGIARGYASSNVPVWDAGAAVSTRLTAAVERLPGAGAPSSPFAIVVGDAGSRKGIEALIRRWPEVVAQRDLRLVLIGAGAASAELRSTVTADPSTTIEANVSDGELAWWYRHAEVVIDAALEEGFGFPRIEAAHFGTPFVAVRDRSGATDWVDAVVSGRASSGDALDEKVSDVDPNATWDDVARRTVEAYRSTVESWRR